MPYSGLMLSLTEEAQIKSYLQKLLFPRYQYENNPFLMDSNNPFSPHLKSRVHQMLQEGKNSSSRVGFRNFSACRGNTGLLVGFFTFLTASKCSVADKSAGNKIL